MKYQKRNKRYVGPINNNSSSGYSYEYYPELGLGFILGKKCVLKKINDKYIVSEKGLTWSERNYYYKFIYKFKKIILQNTTDKVIKVDHSDVQTLTENYAIEMQNKDVVEAYNALEKISKTVYDPHKFVNWQFDKYIKILNGNKNSEIDIGKYGNEAFIFKINIDPNIYIVNGKVTTKEVYELHTTKLGKLL